MRKSSGHRSHRQRPARTALCAALALAILPPPALAAPLALSTLPAEAVYREPAPNIIVSVDDSGSMGAAGMAALRDALSATFSAANLPDHLIRLAWQSMNRCNGIPRTDAACGHDNGMRPLAGTHRSRFLEWVDGLVAEGGTPSHQMMRNAGEYLRTTGVHSPWQTEPGVDGPILGCRRAYHVFMTDGGWNSSAHTVDAHVDGDGITVGGGNADNLARALPDGTSYPSASDQTRIYRDDWGLDTLSTLSDLAFHYWATDLQPGVSNQVSPLMPVAGSTLVTATADPAASVVLQPYWNPRNNPATWQHMATYTIGFGNAAAWEGAPTFGGDTHSGSYANLVTGRETWPSPLCSTDNKGSGNLPCNGTTGYAKSSAETVRNTELWHMAINGRGSFVPAASPEDLKNAFADILGQIVRSQGTRQTSLAASAQTTRTDLVRLSAGYEGKTWRGHVEAHSLAAGSGAVGDTALWNSAGRMDDAAFSPDARKVFSSRTMGAGGATTAIEWRWSELSDAQKAQLDRAGGIEDGRGEDRLHYLRGDRGLEGSVFRERSSRHGDIVNSRLWFTPGRPAAGYRHGDYAGFRSASASRPSMVYVGANDGMLHGFDASDGSERIAYVPAGLHARLSELTRKSYPHHYYVDGSPFTADLRVGGHWKTYLAGFPGAGGRGYFVLDVTDPTDFGTASVVMDRTASDDPDIGHVTGAPSTDPTYPGNAPQIAQLNDGRWALVMGNGYNSANERAVLLIQYLDGARELKKIETSATGSNGLSTPRLVDLDGDRRPDVAYAGDLQGNLWKFNLKDEASTWQAAFGGTPLFVAQDGTPAASRQPITVAPVWQPHPAGGVMVVFGTGRDLTDEDRGSTAVQSVYGIHDKEAFNAEVGTEGAVSGRDMLQPQTFSSASTATTSNGNALWTLSANALDATRRGWYIDLSLHPGERVLDNPGWYEGQLIDVPTTVPAIGGNAGEESCDPPVVTAQDHLLTVNALSGHAPKSHIYAYAADGAPAPGGTGAPSYARSGLRLGLRGSDGNEVCIATHQNHCDGRKGLRYTQLRPAWRQFQ